MVVPQGAGAADTVRLFALNASAPLEGGELNLSQDEDLEDVALSADQRFRLVEFGDPRMMLRTAAWEQARDAVTQFQEVESEGERARLARFLARAIESRGFWSVWASVFADELSDRALLVSVFAPASATADAIESDLLPPKASLRAFAATRGEWLTSPGAEELS
jgi:hypothetical protein